MATTPANAIDLLPTVEHRCVTAYVDLALDDVVGLFSRPEIDELLCAAIRAASGSTHAWVTTGAAAPTRVSSSNAWVPITWHVMSRDGRLSEGEATISILMVQSGQEPVTELLAALTTGEEAAASIVAVAHRFLNELAARLPPLDAAL